MSDPEALSHLERGQLIAGKYRLRKPLDAGGMGAVWVAHHEDLGIDVAVKFVQPDIRERERSLARFRREARAAARLKSPHTAQILDYGVDEDLPYIAMELLEGHHLGVELKRHAPLPPARVAELVGQAAKGLAEAHAAGIVHRDVKPANLFLARVAGEEVVKVLDFGIAKMLFAEATGEHVATETGTLLGSPRYMSPEQASGDPVDHRSDLFSLAAVAFEALTGRRLFTASHLGSLVLQVTKAKVPPLETVQAGLPHQLDDFFARALAVNPDVRFPEARTFADALRAACAGETFEAAIADEETADGVLDEGTPRDDGPTLGPPLAETDPQAETATTSVSNAIAAGPPRRRWPGALVLLGLVGLTAWWMAQDTRGFDVAAPVSTPAPGPVGTPAPSSADAPPPAATTMATATALATAHASASATVPPSPPAAYPRPRPAPVVRPPPLVRSAPVPRPSPPPSGDGVFDPRPRQ